MDLADITDFGLLASYINNELGHLDSISSSIRDPFLASIKEAIRVGLREAAARVELDRVALSVFRIDLGGK